MLTKQYLLKILHNKLVKKIKTLPDLLSDPLIQGLCFLKENGLIILGDLPILKKIGLFSRATCLHTHISLFSRATYPHTHFGLFSRATSPHTLTLVYFHGQPAHTYSHWSIFTGNLPF
jgi:hypothetical protein